MKRNSKIVLTVLIMLAVASAVAVFINYGQSKERLKSLNKQEIVVSEKGQEISSLKMEDLSELETYVFDANLKSSIMISPETHTYEGVTLAQVFALAGISLDDLDDKNHVMVESVDGYRVPLKIEEITALENIYLVYKDDGKYLGSYGEKDGQGPYMIVIKGDKFSQRWAKYVTGLDVE